jgi:hypothetical protein
MPGVELMVSWQMVYRVKNEVTTFVPLENGAIAAFIIANILPIY